MASAEKRKLSGSVRSESLRDLLPPNEDDSLVVAPRRNSLVQAFKRRSLLGKCLGPTRGALLAISALDLTEQAVQQNESHFLHNVLEASPTDSSRPQVCCCSLLEEEETESSITMKELQERSQSLVEPTTLFALTEEDYAIALVQASRVRRAERNQCKRSKSIVLRRSNVKRPTDLKGLIKQLLQSVKSGNCHVARKLTKRMILCYPAEKGCISNGLAHALYMCVFAGHETCAKVAKQILDICTICGIQCTFMIPDCAYSSISEKMPILCEAVRQGSHRVVVELLKAGNNPNFRMVQGCTPLMVSAYNDDVEMINLLLSFGGDPNQPLDNGIHALCVASYRGCSGALAALLANGANPNAQALDGTTALIIAIQEDRKDIMHLLLKAGADVNLSKSNGSSPIIVAVRHHRAHMIPLLCDAGGDPNLELENGATAILLACANGDVECVHELLSRGADPEKSLRSGAAALEYACHRGHFKIVLMILRHMNGYPAPSRVERLTAVARTRGHSDLAVWLETLSKTWDFGELHYMASLNEVPRIFSRVQECIPLPISVKGSVLTIAHPHAGAFLRRAWLPFSFTRAALWPRVFVKVAKMLYLKEVPALKPDVLSYILTFCDRDWFIEKRITKEKEKSKMSLSIKNL